MNALMSSARRPSTRSRRGAFSLLEVAFALVIFVIGAIALLRIFPSGLNVLEDSGNRRIAAQMSQNVLTSYNSGDLATTTPDAIYDAKDSSGSWNDYPSSPIGLRRQSGTVPTNPDDFNSAKDSLKYIRGEREGVTTITDPSDGSRQIASFFTNYAADRQINISREAIIDGVSVYNNTTIPIIGALDFRNAVYSMSNRLAIDSQTTKAVFREPILKVDSVTSTPTSSVQYGAYSPRVELSCADQATTYTLTFARDYTSNYPVTDTSYGPPSLALAANTTADWSGGAAPSGFAATITPAVDSITVQITVPASTTPRDEASFKINFNKVQGLSMNCSYVVVDIHDTRGGTAIASPQINAPLLPVFAPKQLRTASVPLTDVTYYVSSTQAQDQPVVIPFNDSTYPTIPNYNVNTILSPKLRIRQKVTNLNIGQDRARVYLPYGTIPDVDNYIDRSTFSQYCLDYNVRDWEFVSEDVAQFGTPYPGDNLYDVDTNTAEGQAQQQFLVAAGYSATNKMKRGDLREIRTHIGNLRGGVQIKGFYGQSSVLLDVSFNPLLPAQGVGTLSTTQQQAYTRQANILAKNGRLYLPANYNGQPLSHARVYYRSRDAWAQQVGVTAPHYISYNATNLHEPWREYFVDGNYLYFHASEAGKTVEVVHGADEASAIVDTVEIRPDLIINNLPSGMPTNFTSTYTNPDPTISDSRNGKTYLARSRDPIKDTVFDIRRPTGTSGISVRTLWLNNDRYGQELAQ